MTPGIARSVFAGFLLAALALFAGLSVWQFQRLAWKEALLAQLEVYLAGVPVEAPGPGEWAGVSANSAYRKIKAQGRFVTGKDTLVLASTRLGRGFWLLTPLETQQGFTLLVNRGFVPYALKNDVVVPEGPVAVSGFLRLSEPGGSFLQANNAEEGRWYSRDTAAIAAHHGLTEVAPYFMDVMNRIEAGKLPVPGLTVIHFRNHHLQYALTWLVLALMAGAGCALVVFPQVMQKMRRVVNAKSRR